MPHRFCQWFSRRCALHALNWQWHFLAAMQLCAQQNDPAPRTLSLQQVPSLLSYSRLRSIFAETFTSILSLRFQSWKPPTLDRCCSDCWRIQCMPTTIIDTTRTIRRSMEGRILLLTTMTPSYAHAYQAFCLRGRSADISFKGFPLYGSGRSTWITRPIERPR